MTQHRSSEAGVSLIEMLVVLALFAAVGGAVALSLPNAQRETSAEAEARALVAHLDRALDIALATNEGFGITHDGAEFSFVQRDNSNRWAPHSNNRLAVAKLSAPATRISINSQEVFSVSADLIPDNSAPFRATYGNGEGMWTVVFDGGRVRQQEGP